MIWVPLFGLLLRPALPGLCEAFLQEQPHLPVGEKTVVEGQLFFVDVASCLSSADDAKTSGMQNTNTSIESGTDGSGSSSVRRPLVDSGVLADEIAVCLDEIASGNLEARDRVFELLSERLYLLARRMLSRYPRVRRWNDTDDVFQAAAMRLHRALADTQPESVRGLLALAGTQMHRELIDLARRYTSQGAYEANHGTNVIGEDDSGRALHAVDHASQEQEPLDRWSAFHKAVEQLPAEAREVFDLVWYMGASQETAASVVGCSTRTIKTRWRQARIAIKRALDDQHPDH